MFSLSIVGGSERPRFSRVTDRDTTEALELLSLTEANIKPGDKVVISGSGLQLSFETYLKSLGAQVAIVDQSLNFSSREYHMELNERWDQKAATYARKDIAHSLSPVSDSEFRKFRQSRWQKVKEICSHVFMGQIPHFQISDTIKNVQWFIDLIGPGHYIKEADIPTYLADVIECLDPQNGTAIIYPIGKLDESSRDQAWKTALDSFDTIRYETYDPNNDGRSYGVKISRVTSVASQEPWDQVPRKNV